MTEQPNNTTEQHLPSMTLRRRTDSTTYQSVVRVPQDLVAVLGKTQIQKSLGTSSLSDANRLDKIHEGECEQLFDRKRRELRGEMTLTPDQVRIMARNAIRTFRAQEFGDPFEGGDCDLRDLQDEFSSLHKYAPAAAKLIEEMNANLNAEDVAAVRRIIAAEYEADLLRDMAEVGAPSYIAVPPPEPPKKRSQYAAPEVADSTYNLGSKGRLTLEKACELVKKSGWWLGLPAKTKKNYEPTYALLCRLLGKDREVHTLTPEDSSWLRRMVDAMPMHLSKKGDACALIEAGIDARARGKPKAPEVIASGTKNKHRTVIRHVFSYLTENWYLKTDITANFKPWSNADRKNTRIQFTDKELEAIIIRTSQEPRHSELFWIPLCAIHTGARRGELCQLTPHDIIQYEGVWVFSIATQDEDQSLKNEASRRIVPIHSTLIRLGFLDFVAENRRNRNGRIWRDLKQNNNGWGDHFGKKFGRAIDGLSTTKPGYIKDFHSLRHTVKASLEPHLDYGTLDALLGWSSEERRVFERIDVRKKHTRDGYGSARTIDRLKDAVELIQYPWLVPLAGRIES